MTTGWHIYGLAGNLNSLILWQGRRYNLRLTWLIHAGSVTRGASAIREKTLQELRKYFREDKFVELTLVICMGNLTNRFNEALKISPDLG